MRVQVKKKKRRPGQATMSHAERVKKKQREENPPPFIIRMATAVLQRLQLEWTVLVHTLSGDKYYLSREVMELQHMQRQAPLRQPLRHRSQSARQRATSDAASRCGAAVDASRSTGSTGTGGHARAPPVAAPLPTPLAAKWAERPPRVRVTSPGDVATCVERPLAQ